MPAQALPLIGIEGPADPEPVRQLWRHLSDYQALMFVSPASVDWFFRLRPAGATWPDRTTAAAPGPGTARQLLASGQPSGLRAQNVVSPALDAPQFDSETLWPLLSTMNWANQRVCIISGGDQQEAKGRTWLIDQWRHRGATVDTLLTYQRGPAVWSPAQQSLAKQALAHPNDHIWLLSSSEAIDFLTDHLAPCVIGAASVNWPGTHALVTHPRIADKLRSLGTVHLIQTRPDLAEVVLALRSAV